MPRLLRTASGEPVLVQSRNPAGAVLGNTTCAAGEEAGFAANEIAVHCSFSR